MASPNGDEHSNRVTKNPGFVLAGGVDANDVSHPSETLEVPGIVHAEDVAAGKRPVIPCLSSPHSDEPDSPGLFRRHTDSQAAAQASGGEEICDVLELVPPTVEEPNSPGVVQEGRKAVYGVMLYKRRVVTPRLPRFDPSALPPLPPISPASPEVPAPVQSARIPRPGTPMRPPSYPPVLDPIHLHRSRGFIKQFSPGFKSRLALPMDFARSFRGELSGRVHLLGDSMFPTQVSVKEENGRMYLESGWPQFVAAERIARNDIGLFVLMRPFRLVLRLYGPNGLEKPMALRPQPGDPALDDVPNSDSPQAPGVTPSSGQNARGLGASAQVPSNDSGAQHALVPPALLGMQYQLGPRVIINPVIMQVMADVWFNRVTSYPLYVVRLVRTHIYAGYFYFATQFSSMLPRSVDVTLHYGDDDENVYPASLSRSFLGEQVARITAGWFDFVHMNGLMAGDVYVVKIREIAGTLRLRFFPVDE